MSSRNSDLRATLFSRIVRGSVAIALTIAIFGAEAEAQFGGSRRGGGMGGFQPTALRELGRDSIIQELKLTDEQQTKVRELSEAPPENAEQIAELFAAMGSAQTDDERAVYRVEMQKLGEARDLKLEDQLRTILTPEQATRLEQIVLHRAGPSALVRPDRAEKLKLTDEQRQKFTELSTERQNGMMGNFGLSREERDALDKEWNDKFLAVLTEHQRTEWTAWLGPAPPEIPEGERGGRGFGRRGGGERREGDAPATAATTESATSPAGTASPAPAGGAVASFDPAAGSAEGKLSFNFSLAPWTEVLRDFARRAGLTLEMKDVPPGSFTYYDRKEYTPKQALDILNGPLLRIGYVLVQRDEFLICANIDKGPAPNLIPYITSVELANRGDNEFLTVVFSVKGVDDIATLATQVQEMLGPQGKAVGVAAAGALVVTDLGTNLRRVNDLLSAMSALLGPEDVKFQGYPLQHIGASEAEQLLRGVLGLKVGVTNVSGGDRRGGGDNGGGGDRRRGWGGPWGGGGDNGGGDNGGGQASAQPSPFAEGLLAKTQFAADSRTNQLLVTAPAVVHVLIDQALKTIDVPVDAAAMSRRDNVPYLQVYELRSASVEEAAKTIDAIMPGVVINDDGRGDRVHIMGTAAQHREVESLIRQLDGQGGGQNVAVIPLSVMDPLVASTTLQQMFTRDGSNAPTIQADLAGRQVMVRGSADQIAQVKALLTQLGEDGSGRRARGAGGTVRRFSLSGRDSQQLLDLIDQAWRTTQPNRIEVVPTDPISPVRGIERPADEATDADDRRRRDNESVSQIGRGNAAQFVAFVEEPGSGEADGSGSATTTDSTPATTSEDTSDEGRREIAPGIFIQVQGDELILMSEDEAALDRLEEMLEDTLLALPATTSWKLFLLQSADATTAAEMLEQLIPDASVSQVSSASSNSGFFGSLSTMGNSLLSSSGLSSSPAGGLRIIPDLRQNALYVSGPASKVAEVREFLRYIDSADMGGTLRDRVPHLIPVRYAEVTDVHRVVRDVYRDFLEGEPAQGAANPFAMLMGGGRGGRDQQQQQQPKDYKLTVGMDEQTSHLIVSADEGLYQEILELVTSLDNAARDARRTVRVVELENASTSAVQNTLGAVMPRVRVSSSGARTSRTDSSSSGTNGMTSPSGGGQGQQQQGPSQDQMRQFFEQRMRERMMGGGNTGGGGDGQQRSFFFGGNRGGGNQGGGDSGRRRGGRN